MKNWDSSDWEMFVFAIVGFGSIATLFIAAAISFESLG